MNELVVKKIVKNQKKIFANIKPESIAVYLFLKNEYKRGDVKNNLLFQFVFRSYYRLDSAGLSDRQKIKYFELLASHKNHLKIILNDLYKLKDLQNKNKVQFSFATKLLHTLDNNEPIFDAEVSRVFPKSKPEGKRKKKIESCPIKYGILKDTYSSLLQDERIKKIILEFRSTFNVRNKNKMSDVKVLDFIIWSLGKLNKKKLKAIKKKKVI